MKKLTDYFEETDCMTLHNGEQLYSFCSLACCLKKSDDLYLAAEDALLVPYYVVSGEMPKVYEIYEYELNIDIVDRIAFKAYVLSKTGRKKWEDIPEEVISLHQMCYLPVLRSEMKLSVLQLLQYIENLLEKDDVVSTITKLFGMYDREKMMFSYYGVN